MSALNSEKRPYKYAENKKASGRETQENHRVDLALLVSPCPPFKNISVHKPCDRAAQGTESHMFSKSCTGYWKTPGQATPQRHNKEKVDVNHQTTHYPINQRQTWQQNLESSRTQGILMKRREAQRPNGEKVGCQEVGSKVHKRETGTWRRLDEGKAAWIWSLSSESLAGWFLIWVPISFPQTRWVHGIQQQNGAGWRRYLQRDLVGAYWTEIDQGYHSTTPCLYNVGKSLWTGETSGCHARAVVFWEKDMAG